MGKRVFIVFLFLLVLSFGFVLAQESTGDDTPTGPGGDAGVVIETVNQLPFDEDGINDTKFEGYKSKTEERIDWLKNNTKFLKPITKYGVGEEFDFSWRFFIALAVWVFWIGLFFSILNGYGVGLSTGAVAAISLIIGVILGNLGMITRTTDWVFYLLNAWWTKLIAFVAVCALIYVEIRFGKVLKQKRAKFKEEMAKMQQSTDRKVLHTTTTAITEGMGNS